MKERRSEKRKTDLVLKKVPVKAVLTIADGWTVTLHGERFKFSFTRRVIPDPEHAGRTSAQSLHFDPYPMRERFLAITKLEEAMGFFKKYGPLDVSDPRPMVEMAPGAAGVASDVSFESLIELQRLYAKALLSPKQKFTELREVLRLNLFRSPNFSIHLLRQPVIVAESAYVSQAIYTTLYLDRLAGLKSVRCPECHRTVRQENQHFQRFCSAQCGRRARKKKFLAKENRHG
jgi:hypothetical protein